MDARERNLDVLGLGPDATPEDAKRAFRELTKRWHPDRFAHDPRLQAEATEELRRIVEAYHALTGEGPRMPPETASSVIVPPAPPAPAARPRRRPAQDDVHFVWSRGGVGAPPSKPKARSRRRLLAARLVSRAGLLLPLALGTLTALRLPRPAGLGAASVLLAVAGLALGAWLVGGGRRAGVLVRVGRLDGALTAALAVLILGGFAALGRFAPFALAGEEESYPVYTWGGVGDDGGPPVAAAPPGEPTAEPAATTTASMSDRPPPTANPWSRTAPPRAPVPRPGSRAGAPPRGAAPAAQPAPVTATRAAVAGSAAAPTAASTPTRAAAEPASPSVSGTAAVRAQPAASAAAVAKAPSAADPARASKPAPVAVAAAPDPTAAPTPAPARAAEVATAAVSRAASPAAVAPPTSAPPAAVATPAPRLAERQPPAPDGPISDHPTRGPILLNARDVGLTIDAEYPAELRRQGIGGTVVVRALIEADGSVRRVVVRRSSGRSELDEAARKVARAMWFSPALQGTTPTRVWLQFPVAFGGR